MTSEKTLMQFIHVIGIPRCNIYCILKVMLFNNDFIDSSSLSIMSLLLHHYIY